MPSPSAHHDEPAVTPEAPLRSGPDVTPLKTPATPRGDDPLAPRLIALLGNPNTGKTTLFNRISGLRHKTSNFPGTTLEARVARVRAGVEGGRDGDLIDLPGIYSLELDQVESRICREVLAGQAAPAGEPVESPEVVVVVADATNLARNLMIAGEVLRRRLPTVLAVNMIDLADGLDRHGHAGGPLAPDKLDAQRLSRALGCEVVFTNARDGQGVDALRIAIRRARIPAPVEPVPGGTDVEEGGGDALRCWAEDMYARGIGLEPGEARRSIAETPSDRFDSLALHPLGGPVLFAAIMGGLFYTLFSLAQYPMGWIEAIFGAGTGLVEAVLPEGVLRDLVANGIVAGVGGAVVFLPQICLLFFLISLLEDTGYLARAALLMDRLLRPFGLPGHAFIPLLSSHACALPGIMATRGIPDPKERLATILVAPFMSCSARLPVYVLLTTLLFRDSPGKAALAFVGCYALGIAAGVLSALVARRTLLRGKARAMALELPTYKRPSLRTALRATFDRGWLFLKKAGTVIVLISIVLWWLGAYPHVGAHPGSEALRTEAAGAAAPESENLASEADRLDATHQARNSFLGRMGRTLEPVFAPLGYDWRITIGVMASFAAREVFASTMAVVIAGQEEGESDEENARLTERIGGALRDDGVTPVFTAAVCWSLLVFYVLAMQCLPTLAVTAREAGGVKWALLQLAWMTVLAYAAAFVMFRVMS